MQNQKSSPDRASLTGGTTSVWGWRGAGKLLACPAAPPSRLCCIGSCTGQTLEVGLEKDKEDTPHAVVPPHRAVVRNACPQKVHKRFPTNSSVCGPVELSLTLCRTKRCKVQPSPHVVLLSKAPCWSLIVHPTLTGAVTAVPPLFCWPRPCKLTQEELSLLL